ncbi:MAG: ABC transporter permease [Terracidiphilus sp.]|nr:ABC transporter permease [Terracidiphilus sp.]
MAGFINDLRYALRQLRRSPGFAATAVLMLALGICANSTVFSWINATLLDPIPVAQRPGELVSVMHGQWNTSPAPPLSYPDYRDLRDGNKSFAGLLAYHHDWLTLTGGDRAERIYVANTSGNYFDVLGIRPMLGRFFRLDEEARPGGVPYAVLSYALWQTRFGGDTEIVGKPIEIAQHRLTVIGVAPQGFIGAMPGIRTDVWVPLAANTDPGSNTWIEYRGHQWLNVLGRLRPGVGRTSAQQDLDTLMRSIVALYPDSHLGVNTITLDPMWRSPFGANIYLSGTLPLLLAIAGVVLLLTCANIATLALVRFVSRRRELAVRQSLGASRWALMRQMMLEGALTALAGGGLAVLLTFWSAKTLARFIPPNANPIALNGTVDAHVIATILLLAVAASALCGVLPAWKSSRVSSAEVLKEEAASVAAGGHNRRLLSALVVGQVALSMALLVTAGLFLRSLKAAGEADLGFDQTHVLTASVGLQISGYSSDTMLAFQHKALDKLRTLPGVEAASLTDWLPLDFNRKTADAYPEGYVPQQQESLEVRRADVTAGYFDTLRIPILRGRAFSDDDDEKAPHVVIVDESAAAHYWPRQDAIGKHLNVSGRLCTVVGVVRNSKHRLVSDAAEPMVYLPMFQRYDSETILQVRTSGDPSYIASQVEEMVHGINGRLPVFDVRPLAETTQMALMFQRIQAVFATVFGLLALVLATSGIYGVVAYRTELRTHEIGIRVALGAARGDVLRLVLVQGMRLTVVGLMLGLALAYVLTRFLRGLLYGVSATDPWTAMAVTALLAGIALLACWLPARRAMHVDPMTAIRSL